MADAFPHLAGVSRAWRHAFGPLPDDYLCFDLETCGGDPKLCFLLQVGVCVVRNRRPAHREARRLGWESALSGPRLDHYRSRAKQAADRHPWMADPGVPPAEAVGWLAGLARSNPVLVTFNGWAFDVPVFSREASALGVKFSAKNTSHVDAGSMVKASRDGVYPARGETYRKFAERSLRVRGGRTRWALSKFWVPATGLRVPAGETFHDARTDAWLTHKVVEWFRAASEPVRV